MEVGFDQNAIANSVLKLFERKLAVGELAGEISKLSKYMATATSHTVELSIAEQEKFLKSIYESMLIAKEICINHNFLVSEEGKNKEK